MMLDQIGLIILQSLIVLAVVFIVVLLPLGDKILSKK